MNSDQSDLPIRVIERSLGPDSVINDDSRYSVDGRPIPVAVRPKNIDDLSAILTESHAQDVKVMPVGGGTRLSLGNAAQTPDIALDTTSLNQPVSINSADLTATFEAGMTLDSVQSILAENNQFLAMDAALSNNATIGGILASGTSGPLKWQYGNPRDLVLGMKVVQADGSITKSGGQVVKNVSGYDMARLHVGGLGSLGVVCEVSFKLTPKPANEKTVLAAFDNSESCGDVALSIFNGQVTPLALNVFDRGVLSATGMSNIEGEQYLAVRLGGRPRGLARMVDETIQASRAGGGTTIEIVDGGSALDLWRRISDFGWVDQPPPDVVLRVSLVPNQVQTYIDAIKAPLADNAPSFVASPGYGNVMVFWQSGNTNNKLESSGNAIRALRGGAVSLGGSAIIERCPVELKSEFDVWGEAGDSIEIMRRMKQQYDPKGILNPGRFIGRI